MKLLIKLITCWSIALSLTMFLASCQSEVEPDPGNNNGGNGGGSQNPDFTPDELNAFLVFPDSTKRTGSIPAAPDNDYLIDVKDTLYTIKDFYHGMRITVRHDKQPSITGFYLQMTGATSYYDVSGYDSKEYDSLGVFYFEMEPGDDAEYPFTALITIVPHDAAGNALDEFVRYITVEDPKTDTYPITSIKPCSGCGEESATWIWNYFELYNTMQDKYDFLGPGRHYDRDETIYGCCINGHSERGYKCSDGDPSRRTFLVDYYSDATYKLLSFYTDGTFWFKTRDQLAVHNEDLADYCDDKPGMEFRDITAIYTGTHDFTPGADYLNVEYDLPFPAPRSASYEVVPGKLIYTKHVLVIFDDRLTSVKSYYIYKRKTIGSELWWK